MKQDKKQGEMGAYMLLPLPVFNKYCSKPCLVSIPSVILHRKQTKL